MAGLAILVVAGEVAAGVHQAQDIARQRVNVDAGAVRYLRPAEPSPRETLT